MPSIAVVFASYLEVPESRLREHFQWNAQIYVAIAKQTLGDRFLVYVVTDRLLPMPTFAECVVIPVEDMPVVDGKSRFSLAMAKNTGIEHAVRDGLDVVISTDVDIGFNWKSFCLSIGVNHDIATIPQYHMLPSWVHDGETRIDTGCTGTVSMTAYNWRRIRYNEKCVGYGAEDGILLREIERHGIRVNRDCIVSHVAHVPGDGARTPGSGSGTCWGRESGFNFDNFAANRKHHEKGR